jgi:hypothetical protein
VKQQRVTMWRVDLPGGGEFLSGSEVRALEKAEQVGGVVVAVVSVLPVGGSQVVREGRRGGCGC